MHMSRNAYPTSRPLILTAPTACLILPPAILTLACTALFRRILPSVVRSCSEQCAAISNPLAQTACFFSAFFQQCLSTDASWAFMAAFLPFVAALLTISHVEASRLSNQPSVILTRPAWIWAAVNAVSGAVVSPVVVCVAVKRLKDGVEERRRAKAAVGKRKSNDGGARGGEGRPLMKSPGSDLSLAKLQRHLVSVQQTYAIPIAVALGFGLPSILLVANPSPLVAGLWNLFPVAVYTIHALVLRVLGGSRGGQTPHHAETDWRSVARIYSLPALLSLLSHVHLVKCWLWSAELRSEQESAVALMVVNFWTIAATYLYWLLIESSVSTVAMTVLVSSLVGPGAGIIVGWVRKERRYPGHTGWWEW